MSQTHLKSPKFLNSIFPMLPYIRPLPFQLSRRKYHKWRLNWVVTLNLRWWCTPLSMITLWASSRMAFKFITLHTCMTKLSKPFCEPMFPQFYLTKIASVLVFAVQYLGNLWLSLEKCFCEWAFYFFPLIWRSQTLCIRLAPSGGCTHTPHNLAFPGTEGHLENVGCTWYHCCTESVSLHQLMCSRLSGKSAVYRVEPYHCILSPSSLFLEAIYLSYNSWFVCVCVCVCVCLSVCQLPMLTAVYLVYTSCQGG